MKCYDELGMVPLQVNLYT